MKKTAILILFSLNISLCIAQNALQKQGIFFLAGSPVLQINTDGIETAPSPISFSIGLGYKLVFANIFSFSPEINYWANYYMFYNDRASPASVEKRDAFVNNFLIDLPVLVNLSTKTSIFSFGLGISLLSRLAVSDSVLPENEKYKVNLINEYFWSDLRYFYPSTSIYWDQVLENGSSFGLAFKAFYPIANFNTNVSSSFQNALFCFKIRCFFPKEISKTKTQEIDLK